MHIHLICVGKLKEPYLRAACAEYEKRLSRFCRVTITEVADEPCPERGGTTAQQAALAREAKKILSHVGGGVILPLCVEGKQLSSEEFAALFREYMLSGSGDFTFIIGGSLGLDETVKRRGAQRLSFSKMTFPHQLARVMLLEQIYRVFKINAGETYHK